MKILTHYQIYILFHKLHLIVVNLHIKQLALTRSIQVVTNKKIQN